MILEFHHVTGISKKFALQEVSFSLKAGYIMGLAGKNGAGKSTLFDYIVNPKQLYKGKIKIEGIDIQADHNDMMNRIGFISERNRFFPEFTCRQIGELLGRFYKDWDDTIFYNSMKKMNLSSEKTVGKLSRGEQFKFQTAFAMAHKPALYLIDEATAGMDPVFRIDYFKILQQIIAEETASVLMTSHIQDEMVQKMDYIGILEQGKLVKFGEADVVYT